jgi:hypothetical protein
LDIVLAEVGGWEDRVVYIVVGWRKIRQDREDGGVGEVNGGEEQGK